MGETTTISVVADPSLTDIAIVSPLGFSQKTSAPLQFVFRIPIGIASDTYEISASGLASNGELVSSWPVLVEVEPAIEPIELEIRPGYLEFDSPGETMQLEVIGTFPDGSKAHYTRAVELQYESLDESVVTVHDRGIVTAIAPGTTSIYVAFHDVEITNSVAVKGPPPPMLDSVSPATGPTGTVLTLSGIYFGSDRENSTVTFNDIPAEPIAWSSTVIQVAVPERLAPGNASVVVTVHHTPSNDVRFTVEPAAGTKPK